MIICKQFLLISSNFDFSKTNFSKNILITFQLFSSYYFSYFFMHTDKNDTRKKHVDIF